MIEQIGPHRMILGDCAEAMPGLGRFDACVTDPPYGIKEHGNNTRHGKVRATDYGRDSWDNETQPLLIEAVCKATDWQIIFGGNYYAMPPTSCYLVWDKQRSGDFADCELAWTNLKKAVRRVCYRWNGFIRANQEPRGDHPTQKPIGVMRWCIGHLPQDVSTILDPFAGSGTTGVACALMGKVFTGIEREQKYFDIACRRIESALKQPELFERYQVRDA